MVTQRSRNLEGTTLVEKLREMCGDDEPTEEPSEDDYTSTDHCRWHQNGKLVLSIRPGDNYVAALNAHMAATNVYPDAYWISDHGNAHRLDLTRRDA